MLARHDGKCRTAAAPWAELQQTVSVSRECHNSCITPTNTGERPRSNHAAAQRNVNTHEHGRTDVSGLKIRCLRVIGLRCD